MDAKEYLERVQALDELIANKRWELKQLRHSAEGMTSYAESVEINGELHVMEKVQSSGSLQPMADAVCNYLELARKMDADILEWQKEKQGIISTIESLPQKEYMILYKVYVRGMEIKAVAKEHCMSYSWAKGIHGKGIKKVQRILDKRGV